MAFEPFFDLCSLICFIYVIDARGIFNRKMPKIFIYQNLVFFFYSNEHLPIHVHVRKDNRQMRVVLIISNGEVSSWKIVKERGFRPFKSQDLKRVEFVIKNYGIDIVQKWMDFFVLNKVIKFEVIEKHEK